MSDWVMVPINAVLVAITAVYAFLTYRLAKASDRAAAASERAAAHAEAAARASQDSVDIQRANLAVQRANQPMRFKMHPAGPFASGFGFSLQTDGGSYFVREVSLQNLTVTGVGGSDPGYTLGTDQLLVPTSGTLPRQLDEPDSLTFEVPNARLFAERNLGPVAWSVAWWTCLVSCSFSEDDPVVRRVDVRSPGAPGTV